MTGWLDSVLAAPSVGVTVGAMLRLPSAVWPAVDRFYQLRNAENPSGKFEIAPGDQSIPFGLQINLDGGLFVKADLQNLVAGYTFQVNALNVPGGLPKLADFSLAPFGELQANAAKVLSSFLQTLDFELQVLRIGAVADARIVESQAPPGIARYLADLSTAARGKVLAVTGGSVVTEIRRENGQRDQCHHVCTKNDDGTVDDLTFKLDWQRQWLDQQEILRRMKKDQVVKEIKGVIDAANAYFEKFGSGQED